MGYSRQEILEKCCEAIKDISNFYKREFINYLGRTADTNELYNEVVAEFVCSKLECFKSIPRITREASYKVESHDGQYAEHSNRIEELTAMQMFNQCKCSGCYTGIGKIVDYQTPLKNEKDDLVGKIDLLSINDETVYILELKKEDSTETMLRCVLEGYTYLKTVDSRKLIDDFELTSIAFIKASPLVFYKREQWQEMQEDRPQLKRLMRLLDIVPYYITKEDGKYLIRED